MTSSLAGQREIADGSGVAETGSEAETTEKIETGVCLSPMDWNTLQAIVADGSVSVMRRLGRSRETLQSYREFKERINETYSSIVDKIMIDVFKCDWKVNEDGKMEHVPTAHGWSAGSLSGPPSRSALGPHAGPFFVKNDFPYNLAPGIEHYLLWSDHVMSADEIDIHLQSDPIAKQSSSRLTFVNPVELQSIPDIHHVHVLLKLR